MISRYQDANLAEIWSPQAEIDRWFEVEVHQMGRIRGEKAAGRLAKSGSPTWTAVYLWERETKHDVVAFLRAVDEQIQKKWGNGDTGRELRQWLHYGLTSSDVVDTGLGLALKKTHGFLASLSRRTLAALGDLIQERVTASTIVGRTHGQRAVPMPAQHPWEVLLGMFSRAHRDLYADWRGISVGKLSGPVGVVEEGDNSEVSTLLALGLGVVNGTQIVPRDGIARFAADLAALATVCEAIATQVWLLAQDDIAEVSEGRADGQIGSSAMPHKNNPVCSENIRGLARLARMNAEVLQLGTVQWGEHDLAHSSVERVALPDLCHLVATILTRTTKLLGGLQFNERPIPTSYVNTHEQLMQLQREGVPYVEAHERIRSGSYLDGKIDTNAPCGYGDKDCGIRGGSARCGGCKQ